MFQSTVRTEQPTVAYEFTEPLTHFNFWSSGLCSFCLDAQTCLYALFCPPCFFCWLHHKAEEHCCTLIICPCAFGALRTKIRTNYKISVNWLFFLFFQSQWKSSLSGKLKIKNFISGSNLVGPPFNGVLWLLFNGPDGEWAQIPGRHQIITNNLHFCLFNSFLNKTWRIVIYRTKYLEKKLRKKLILNLWKYRNGQNFGFWFFQQKKQNNISAMEIQPNHLISTYIFIKLFYKALNWLNWASVLLFDSLNR